VRNIGPSLALLALLTTGHAIGQLSTTIQMNKPEKPVVGLPFSADQSVRTVQHLANGMPLTHEVKGHIYRSADATIASTDPAHPDPTTMIYILDRVKRTGVLLNSKLKTATVETLPATATISVSFLALQQPRVQNQLIRPENLVTTDLGKRTLEMMPLVGKRVTGTIPAGKIGNNQPLPVTTDVWFAPQLKLLVNEVEKNPLSGERTFELTNIRAEEPDPTLFDIPEGYTVKDRPAVPSTMPSMLKESAAPPSGPFVPEQRTKQIEDALNNPSPIVKNNVAYGLASNGDHLADAQLLTEQALQLQEQQIADAVSGGDPAKSFDQMVSLSRIWDTTGYVYYRAHKPDRAEAYLRAAWELNPNSLFAIHLGFAYEAEHKVPEAIAIYRMALSAKPSPAGLDTLTTRLANLGSPNAERLPVEIVTPLPALNPQLAPGSEEPLVDIIVSHNHPPSVTFLKGDSALKKPITQAIQSALASSLPDGGPELVIRRARVTCAAGNPPSCVMRFTNTREFTAVEQARRDALRPPLP
jgi:hypothetical protein